MTDPTEAIRKALESFDGGSLLIPVEQLRALLDRLDSAERDRQAMKNALWRACGDDSATANEYLENERAALRVGAVGGEG